MLPTKASTCPVTNGDRPPIRIIPIPLLEPNNPNHFFPYLPDIYLKDDGLHNKKI
jgi:hypothetical protein